MEATHMVTETVESSFSAFIDSMNSIGKGLMRHMCRSK